MKNNKQKQPTNYINIKKDWHKPKTSKLTFVELFAGCGGLSKGFELAGLHGIAGLDNFKEAV
jgi:DNA (cytosine-5)-methyltransferase 1